MGNSSNKKLHDGVNGPISLKSFVILRSIGKGAFGKVSIVKMKSTNRLYALKYMCKKKIVEQNASKNVLREVEILKMLHYQFIVNLQFSFQDDRYMYMVIDLMLGGDLRFHINQGHTFTEAEVTSYILEMALALEYLKEKSILHRDIKPENLLLDSNGHIHLSDFNIATWIPDGKLATSISGTKPYMAPEVFETEAGTCVGYSFEADWWSMGVSLFEILCKERPFKICCDSPSENLEVLEKTKIVLAIPITMIMSQLMLALLEFDKNKRLSSVNDLKLYINDYDARLEKASKKQLNAIFIPSSEKLNCEAIHELEEMITESNPLQKQRKKKLTKKQPSCVDINDPIEELSRKFSSFQRISSSNDEKEMTVETRAILDTSMYSNSHFSSPNYNSPGTVLSPKIPINIGAKTLVASNRSKNLSISTENFGIVRIEERGLKSEHSQNCSTASSAILDGS
ncbi:serine/threonine-protein kinase 32B isoform X1 [Hydra vulgaris]|uniref:serine/threonine-protein kinase 32B isoform X1 n=1 Tax=Hydra vulgaris TaxID=6087 RepID=UPI00064176C6|nr:serine/threonine-protein kinase 32B [Hydra vulgaris]